MTERDDALDLQVDEAFVADVDLDMLQRVIRSTLDAEAQPADACLCLVITDDETVRDLNHRYRDIDRPTDVLSFSTREGQDFVSPGEADAYLGDVIISLPRARAQAGRAGEALRDELALLAVHGCLHLLGYDHATEAERDAMWARQREILAAFDISWSGAD